MSAILRFPDERRMAWSQATCHRYPNGIEADVVVLPVIPRINPDWIKQQRRRCDGVALLFKMHHPTVSVLHSVEPPCDVGCG